MMMFFGGLFGQSRWSAPITFATKTAAPDFSIDPRNGELHIVTIGSWDYRTSGVTYTRTDSLGNVLLQETVPGTEAEYGGWNFGPTVAVDSDGAPHVCYSQQIGAMSFKLTYVNKRDGRWKNYLQLSDPLERGYMVRIAVDGSGAAHIGRGYALNTPWGKAAYDRVINGGLANLIDGLDSYRVDDRLEIDASPDGSVHLVLGCPNANNGPVTYLRSYDGGNTMNPVGDIHSPQCTGRNGSPDVFVDASAIVHICYGSQVDLDADGKPSIRYVRYQNGRQIRNVLATRPGALESYLDGDGWGLGTVAASGDGRMVGIAYLTKAGGDLYFTLSTDSGATWQNPEWIAGSVGRGDGRDKPVLRAYRNHFYLIFPSGQDAALRMMRNAGDDPPAADAGGPYTANEGGTITFNGTRSRDTGLNAGIIRYQWDFENDGIWDADAAVPTVQHAYPGVFSGIVRLKVTDRAGFTSEDTALVRVLNLPPTVELGADRTGKEGETLHFQATVTDPGSDVGAVTWNFGDGRTGQGPNADHAYADRGVYKVKAVAADTHGGTGSDSIHVTIQNSPPTAQADGPYLGPVGATIQFIGTGTDAGLPHTLTYAWDLDNNGTYETPGQNPSRTYDTEGRYIVWLRVTDPDGASAADSATVVIANDRVRITPLTDRTTQEGNAFPPIQLDGLVQDYYHRPDQITWRIRGNQALAASIESRVLSVHPLDGEWSGSEDLWLSASDPAGNSDSIRVRFVVIPVNDAPDWIRPNPDITMLEDSSAVIPLDSLRARVHDRDNPIRDITFGILGNQKIQWSLDAAKSRIVLRPVPDWYGSEQIVVAATDKDGASGLDTMLVIVRHVIDPPAPFSLIDPLYSRYNSWPDTIRFHWRASSTQDSIGVVYYAWNLHYQGGLVDPLRRAVVSDTVYAFVPDAFLPDGIFYWNVEAVDQHELIRKSDNMGILQVKSSGIDSKENPIPAAFRLDQNYPNPFNPSTRITFGLPRAADIRLEVYNPLGQQVRVLFSGNKSAGMHTVEWDGRDAAGGRVPSGVYMVRLETGSGVFFRKMVLAQ
jgi:PKD repeat protein